MTKKKSSTANGAKKEAEAEALTLSPTQSKHAKRYIVEGAENYGLQLTGLFQSPVFGASTYSDFALNTICAARRTLQDFAMDAGDEPEIEHAWAVLSALQLTFERARMGDGGSLKNLAKAASDINKTADDLRVKMPFGESIAACGARFARMVSGVLAQVAELAELAGKQPSDDRVAVLVTREVHLHLFETWAFLPLRRLVNPNTVMDKGATERTVSKWLLSTPVENRVRQTAVERLVVQILQAAGAPRSGVKDLFKHST